MRKLKLQVQMSLDGFIAGTSGEMDWMNFNWSEDLKQYVEGITAPVDTILLGRNLAEGFIPYWTEAFNKTEPEEGSEKLATTPKVVFSKSLTTEEFAKKGWGNTVLAKGDLREEITALKKKNGCDMIVYGGAKFVSSLIKEQLIDELHLFINPSILGKGMSIFQAVTEIQQYQLIDSNKYDCGIVVLTYKTL